MHDVLRHVVLAPGDENLGAVDPVVIAFRHRLCAYRGQIRTGLRLRQVHGASPLARHQMRQVGRLLLVGAVARDREHRARSQHRAQAERHAGGVPHLRGLHRNDMRQSLPSPLRIVGERHPACFAELPERILESGRGSDDITFQLRTALVARPVQRIEHPRRELAGFFEHCIDQIRRNFLAAGQLGDIVNADQLLHHEPHVANRRSVCGHHSLLKEHAYHGGRGGHGGKPKTNLTAKAQRT